MYSPKQIATNYITVAQQKTSMQWYKTLVLAILAGIFIAFGGVVSTVASTAAEGGAAALVKAAVFPVGLILVVICGAELFTGNCLLISPTISGDIKASSMLINWVVVYIGNLIGSILIAILVVYSHVLSESAVTSAIMTAATKSDMGFGDSLLRGILCNMLVCLAVWASMASNHAIGKIAAVYLPIFTFVAAGFEHSVANMYYLSAGLMASSEYNIHLGGLTVGKAILNSLLPSTIGNIIGGCFIAIAYHVVFRLPEKPKEPQN